jgi:hypothetical protein
VTAKTLIFDGMGTVVDIEGSIAAQARAATGLGDEELKPVVADWDARVQRAIDEIVAGRTEWARTSSYAGRHSRTGCPARSRASSTGSTRGPTRPRRSARCASCAPSPRSPTPTCRSWPTCLRTAGSPGTPSSPPRQCAPTSPQVYDMALAQLGVAPEQAMLVAAHRWDLRGRGRPRLPHRLHRPPGGRGDPPRTTSSTSRPQICTRSPTS